MSDRRGPYRLTCFEADRVTVYGSVTLASGDALTGATLQFRGWPPGASAGSEPTAWNSAADAISTASVVDADEYEAEVYTAGFAAGVYPWEVRRTDSGHEGVLVYGFLTVKAHPPR